MATIFIRNLLVQARHGVLAQERAVGNTFRVSVTLEAPGADDAAETDDLSLTINYAEAVAIIRSSMSHPRQLLETAAADIIRELRAHYGESVATGSVTVEKLAPPIPGAELDSVGVTLRF